MPISALPQTSLAGPKKTFNKPLETRFGFLGGILDSSGDTKPSQLNKSTKISLAVFLATGFLATIMGLLDARSEDKNIYTGIPLALAAFLGLKTVRMMDGEKEARLNAAFEAGKKVKKTPPPDEE